MHDRRRERATRQLDAKPALARFFFARMLPKTGAHLARIVSGAETADGVVGCGILTAAAEGLTTKKINLVGSSGGQRRAAQVMNSVRL